MADEIETEVQDNYLEHELHKETPDPECSTCYSELNEHKCAAFESDEFCETCIRFAKIITE